MNKIPEIIKQSQLLRRLVFDKNTVKNQGRVDKLWLNCQGNRVAGVSCKLELFGDKRQYLSWEEIDAIGADAILANVSPDGPAQEEPEDEVVAIGSEIWTDAGNKVGWLADYLFNIRTGAVVNLLYRYEGWKGMLKGLYLLSPESISSAGNKRVIVADGAVLAASLYASGLGNKIARATAYLEEDLQKTKEDIESMRRGSQGWTENFQGKAQQVKEQAQQKAEEIKEKAQTLATEAQQKAGEIKEKVREQHQELKQGSQDVSDGSGENAGETSNQFENQIKEVTEKAKEMIGGIKSRQDAASEAKNASEPEVEAKNASERETEAKNASEPEVEAKNASEPEVEAKNASEPETDVKKTDEAAPDNQPKDS
jgi:uncharacterized protein YrrD